MKAPRVSNPVTWEHAEPCPAHIRPHERGVEATLLSIRLPTVFCALLAGGGPIAACVPAAGPVQVIQGAAAKAGEKEPGAAAGLVGEWGGEHIRLVVTEAGAKAEFDCAVGAIEVPIHLDAGGRFEVRGVFMYERGGPSRRDDPPLPRHPALYRGETDGREMKLTVILTEQKKEVGTFGLALGRPASLEKCL